MSAAAKLTSFGSEELLENYLNEGHLIQLQPENPHFQSDSSMIDSIKKGSETNLLDPKFILKSFQTFKIWELKNSGDKVHVMNDLRLYMKDSVNQSLLEDSMSCADEMITNSIFNAPFSKPMDRKSINLGLPSGKVVHFGVGQNEKELFVMCSDPFGTLDTHSFFSRILNCYKNGVGDSINYGEGGAGIGSYMVFEHASSMIVSVKPNFRTIIGCKFPKTIGSKKRKVSPKNLIIFNWED